jgi:cell division protein FtsW
MARKLAVDRWLFTAVVLLVGLGLVMVYSASAPMARARGAALNPYFARQLVAALLGFAAMFALMQLDYRHLRRAAVAWALVGGAVALLVAVLFAPALNSTRRWLFVAGISIQPSELSKLALVLFLAHQLDRHRDRVGTRELLLPAGLATLLVAGLVVAEPDLGTSFLLVATAAAMLFLAGLPWRYVALGAVAALPAIAALVLAAPYRRARLLAFLDPERDPLGSGFQALQSLIAIGSGGVLGLGPGESVQKLYFLPYPHSDFVFAILAEELGLLGAVVLLVLFAILLWRGLRAGWLAPEPFGRHLAWGCTALLALQALINVSVAVALFPTKGIPLPFVSYGGSSMVVSLAACGLLLNVSQHGG